ncbi:MAG: DNA polymerase I [Candidatus Ozemobacter sibiricus]|uniref:DNA polymerase I n=1 Tax=Candidatus Ozemobacter sibiricus TaxID=2268124 RepID=A0A367ZU57_9BACT|nr:MAG: DNA polymerase I [Candidatus Ozemobacter sibiricus]
MGLCLLIDGNNLVFRAFYALDGKNLKTRSGQPTGALFGFTKMLIKLLKDKQPAFAAAAFDVSRETFRKRLYPEYKAQRRPTTPELLAQLPLAHQAIEAMGIRLLTDQEFEADDLLGSLAARLKKEGGHEVLILTGDRDLLQVIDEGVRVELCVKGISETKVIDRQVFEEAYGFPPAGIIDLKALQGDASDNIPGVDGIGEKKGLALIRQFGSLDRLYASLDRIENERLRAQVEAGRDSAFLSRQLATIRCDVERLPPLADLAWDPERLRTPRFHDFLRKWELYSLLPEVGGAPAAPRRSAAADGAGASPAVPDAAPSAPAPTGPASETGQRASSGSRRGTAAAGTAAEGAAAAEPGGPGPGPGAAPATGALRSLPGERLLLSTLDDLRAFLAGLGPEVAIDVETDGFDPRRNRIIGLSLADSVERAAYVPLRHAYLGLDPSDQIPPEQAFPVLAEGLADKTLVGHNLKFDLAFLQQEGFPLPTRFFDTLLAAYVLDPTSANGLKDLARDQLGFAVQTYAEVAAGKPFAQISLFEASQYACQDALLTMHLLPRLRADLEAHQQSALFHEIEQPLLPLLLEMETIGIGLARPYLQELSRWFADQMKQLEASIQRQAGQEFNVNSGKQLQEVLFGKLGLTPPKKTKTGFSTDSDVLKELAAQHPICRDLLSYREIAKLKTTYADALEALVDPRTGLIHTSFHQTVTATGRLSSTNPNLQNIPIKSELGRRVRRAFVPPRAGDVFLSLDYSQIELRLLAHLSEDPDLIAAFQRQLDVHAITAAKLFKVPVDEVTPEQRKVGKTVNFGIIYGISAHGLAAGLGVSRAEAKAYIDGFFATFPSVQAYFARTQADAKAKGYVSTIFGRIRRLRQLDSSNFQARSFEERVARNTPLQGSAADLVKKAMLDVDRYLKREGKRTRLILQIHDELVFTAPRDEVAAVAPHLKALMETVIPLRIPLVCDMAVGPNLADLEEYRG